MSQSPPSPRSAQRGEIWLVNFDPTIGHEQAGRRPGLVISNTRYNSGRSDLIVVLPLTSTIRALPTRVAVAPPEVRMVSDILCDQIRAIAIQRLERPLGSVAPGTLLQVEAALRALLEL